MSDLWRPMPGAYGRTQRIMQVEDEEIPLRSAYMRLYRARQEGTVYPAAVLDEALLRLLCECGHVEPVNGGYRLTDAGVQAWAWMCEPILNRMEKHYSMFDELKQYLTR